MNERILVVDDEKAIADLVGIYLTKEGFDVQIAYSGADAAKAILEQEFDLALLDVMLPDIDGFELLRTIRASHTYLVIMLTARDAQQDKIESLSLGADDYVVKPFRPLELIARVHAQLRRYTSYGSRAQATESPTLQLDGLDQFAGDLRQPTQHAFDSAGGILGNITSLLKGGIQMLGAIMVVWGGVTIGINVHNGASGNGAAIAAGVGTLIGGVIVSAAALYFGTLDTSWVRG